MDYVRLNGRLIGRISAGQIDAVHADQLDRPEEVTSASKAVVWRAQNLPFTQNVTTANGVTLNLGFPGQYYDAETQTWNNGYRDYNDGLGRYLESDPIGLAGGVDTYAYVDKDPLSYTDPLGLTKYTRVPANAVQYISGSGVSFYAPPGANFGAVGSAGQSYGSNPFAMLMNEGQGGTYDFQRNNGDFYSQYSNASNYGVGVYLFNAGYTADEAIDLGEEFATFFSANAGDGTQVIGGFRDGMMQRMALLPRKRGVHERING